MVEVFKTNITKQKQAKQVLEKLKKAFPDYKINFDLEDCDNILRVENPKGTINNTRVIELVSDIGLYIETLLDELSIVDKSEHYPEKGMNFKILAKN
ncbi:hypothetical protein ACFSKN_16285 [Mariniflexile gromovii]|uniref:Uncharacterized protein n=1 Tax=Mariniflexile gromovii TaxID=362523 RepID=A0ABS4BUI8_9FLAO|nr:hypothetical protein [Mariniflexile gromovii]MBP0904254.1 hypothetical protein [Mariniflexile gromovii]